MAIRGTEMRIEGLSHRYPGRKQVTFSRVDLVSPPGEALAIIGRSGCGKSTLLHIIAGLLKPSEGRVVLNGTEVLGPSPRWVMMFQAPHLYPWMTVRQNVGVGLTFGKWSKAEIEKRVNDAIRLVELEEFAESNVQDLSGGQQQRVALARSLVMEPELLLLDEPFSALDAFTRAALQKDVRSIAKRLGFNIIIVTHDIDEAVIMADRAVIMAGSPGTIMREMTIDLPDPRERSDPAVQKLRAQLLSAFQEAVARGGGSAQQVAATGGSSSS
ncbi:MAG: ABC transporter ATP-binding protein [Burkholderiales bacterium]|nr:ABC transporter ATP-binding protein [Burkholderiales bacterium]